MLVTTLNKGLFCLCAVVLSSLCVVLVMVILMSARLVLRVSLKREKVESVTKVRLRTFMLIKLAT